MIDRSTYRPLLIALLLLSLFNGTGQLMAQTGETGEEPPKDQITRILFMVDCSRSMADPWGRSSKLDAARRVMNNIVDTLSRVERLEMGLRVYGHQSSQTENDCKDTNLEVPFSPGNAEDIKHTMANLRPRGITPIGYSLIQSATDYPYDPKARNILIMITDGVESCDRDPCAEIEALRTKGVLLRAFVIGLAMEEKLTQEFDCLSDFYNAGTKDDFGVIMSRAMKKVLSNTVVRVNLMDENGKSTETNSNMTFYTQRDGVMRHNFFHTMNSRGQPDTMYLDPVPNYKLRVHTNPPVGTENIDIKPNDYNVIDLPAAQGRLKLQSGRKGGDPIKCLVYKAGENKTLYVQEFGTTIPYLIGKYDLEILTLPRIKVEEVEISQSKTTSFQIPAPGIVTFARNYRLIGSVFLYENGVMKEVFQLGSEPRNETYALQPGTYRVVYRPLSTPMMKKTRDKEFKVISGTTQSIKL